MTVLLGWPNFMGFWLVSYIVWDFLGIHFDIFHFLIQNSAENAKRKTKIRLLPTAEFAPVGRSLGFYFWLRSVSGSTDLYNIIYDL